MDGLQCEVGDCYSLAQFLADRTSGIPWLRRALRTRDSCGREAGGCATYDRNDGQPHTGVVHDREGIPMHMHKSLRERLEELVTHDAEPRFEPGREPALVAFAKIFRESGLYAFDANKHLRTDAFAPIYDCETESQRRPGDEPELFSVTWAPVWQRDRPVTGFRTGRDSSFIGSTPTIVMPPDERTAALLLLVTTTFIHLSGTLEGGRSVVQGAAENDDGGYRFLELSPEPAGRRTHRAHSGASRRH